MATIIDALVLELDLDPSRFNEKQKKAVSEYGMTVEQLEEQNKKLRERNKKVADSFEDVTKKIGAMVAGYVSVGAISSYITQTTQANVATGQLATTLGMAVEKLSQYRQAAKLANISPDAITGTIQSSTNNLNAAAAGQLGGNFWQAYGKLGVQGNLLGPDGKPIPVEEYLRRVQDAVRRTQASGRYSQGQITSFLGELGINQDTAYILESTNHGLDKFLEFSRKIGVQTKGQFESSEKVAGAWNEMSTSASALGRAVLEDLNPALEKMLGLLKGIIDWFKEHRKVFEVLAGIAAGASTGAAVGSVIPGVGTATGAVVGGIAGGFTGYNLSDGQKKYTNDRAPYANRNTPFQYPGAPQAGSAGSADSGSEYIKKQRESRINEINSNPMLKENVLKMLQLEEGSVSGKTGAMEALLNRSIMTGNTIEQELKSGFYGPINRGQLARPLSDAARRTSQIAMDAAAGGSNTIQGRTDQGMAGDPNANGPGRIRIPGTTGIFNFWKGSRNGRSFSHADSAEFADSLNRNAATPWGTNTAPVPWLSSPVPGATLHNQSTNIQHHSSIDIGNINVATQARNASDLATGLEGHMRERFKTIQSTTGLA